MKFDKFCYKHIHSLENANFQTLKGRFFVTYVWDL